MRRGTVNSLLMLSLSLAIGTAHSDSIDTSGEQPWEACGYCHNLDGISLSPRFPHLAGQRRDYLIAQLRAFRSGARVNDDEIMQSIARTLTPHDIEVVADYFSALSLPIASASGDTAASALLYTAGDTQCAVPACSACHGERAMGQAAIPRLAGQQRIYLSKQLDDFADGKRKGLFDHAFMRCLAAPRRNVLAAYISGLHAETADVNRAGNRFSRKN